MCVPKQAYANGEKFAADESEIVCNSYGDICSTENGFCRINLDNPKCANCLLNDFKRARTITTPFEYRNGLGRLYRNQQPSIRKVIIELNLEHTLSEEILNLIRI